jgi:hypothetical protein
MAFDIQAAKAAGYTEEEINAYMQAKPETKTIAPVAPGEEVDPGEPPPPPSAEGYTQAGEGNYLPALGTMAAAAAPYAIPAVATGAGLYGASVAKQGFNAMKAAADARTAQATAQMATAQGLQQRAEQRMAAQAARAVPTGPQILNAGGQPMRAPVPTVAPPVPTVAPPAMTPTPAQPSVVQRGTELAAKMREFAAQRVMPAVGQAGQMAGRGLAAVANSPVTRIGGMAMNAMYSGGLNTNEQAELERRRKMPPTITR